MARPSTAAVSLLTGEREPVRLATTANITLYGLQDIDGITTAVGDRVLAKDQDDATENGIYTASEGTWYRASDARSTRSLQKGTSVVVQEGDTNAGNAYAFQTDSPVIGTDEIEVSYDIAQAAAEAAELAAALGTDNSLVTTIGDLAPSTGRKTIRAMGYTLPDPLASTWKRLSGTPSPAKDWHKQTSDGTWWEIADHVAHPGMFANVGRGADDSTAFLRAFEMMGKSASELSSACMIIPAGTYEVDNLDFNGLGSAVLRQFSISGYGARLKPRSGGSASGYLMRLRGVGSGVGGNVSIEGITFDHYQAATNHVIALYLKGTLRLSVRDCDIQMGGGANGSRGIYMEQTDANDVNTGCFWNTIERTSIHRLGGNYINCIVATGSANALTVRGCDLAAGTAGGAALSLSDNGGTTPYTPNGLRFVNNFLENCSYGIVNVSPNNTRPFGLLIEGNRLESVTNAWTFSMASGSLATAQDGPCIIRDNAYLNVTTPLTNSAGLKLSWHDLANAADLTVTIANGNSSQAYAFASNNGTTELNSNYLVMPYRQDNQDLWVTSKSATGFTLNRAGTSGSLVVPVKLIPHA